MSLRPPEKTAEKPAVQQAPISEKEEVVEVSNIKNVITDELTEKAEKAESV